MRRLIVSGAIALAAFTAGAGAIALAAGTEVSLPKRQWHFQGPFGTYDRAAAQRGYQVYAEVCAACHSLSLLAFSLLMRHPALGTSFLLFYATGHLPFTLYQSVMNVVARSLNYSRPLLMYPAVTWLDAVIARFLLNTLTGMMVSYILLTAIISLTDTGAVLQIGPILMAALMAAALGE